jgi:glycine oxidase
MGDRRVVVVGAGLVGSAVAAELLRRGFDVVLLERAVPGAEASSAAAGILGPQLEHEDDARALELGLQGREATLRWARMLLEETGVDVELAPPGARERAFDDDERRALEQRVRAQQARGLRAEWRDGEAFFPDETSLDPRRYGQALIALAKKRGAAIVTGVPVLGLVEEGGAVRGVRLADGSVQRGHAVVVCAGAWSSLVPGVAELAGISSDDVFPVRGQIVQLQGPPGLLPHMVYGGKGYVVPRRDGRVICGSTMERVGFQKEVTASGIKAVLEQALRLAPELAELPVTSTWAGLRPATRDGLPLLGPTRTPGLFLATGHFRNGVLLAALSAEVIGGHVQEHQDALQL